MKYFLAVGIYFLGCLLYGLGSLLELALFSATWPLPIFSVYFLVERPFHDYRDALAGLCCWLPAAYYPLQQWGNYFREVGGKWIGEPVYRLGANR